MGEVNGRGLLRCKTRKLKADFQFVQVNKKDYYGLPHNVSLFCNWEFKYNQGGNHIIKTVNEQNTKEKVEEFTHALWNF